MLKQLLPAHSFRWLCFEHFPDQILTHFGDAVDLLRENDLLSHYHVL